MAETRFGVRQPRVAGLHKGMRTAGRGGKGLHQYTAPHNRASSSTLIPKGAPGRKPGTTIPKLGKQMSVGDVLNLKFPDRR